LREAESQGSAIVQGMTKYTLTCDIKTEDDGSERFSISTSPATWHGSFPHREYRTQTDFRHALSTARLGVAAQGHALKAMRDNEEEFLFTEVELSPEEAALFGWTHG
jgi:hypothetical protein